MTRFRDIDFSLRRLSYGDINVKTDAAAVSQYLETLLLTQKGEKPFNNNFGTDIVDYLQEPVNLLNAASIRDKIIRAINNYLKNVIVGDTDVEIVVNTQTNSYDIFISYSESDQQEQTEIRLSIKTFR